MLQRCVGCLCLAALLTLSAPSPVGGQEGVPAAPRIYKWVDQNGIAHYTTDPKRVPQALRHQLIDLQSGAGGGEADGSWAVRDAIRGLPPVSADGSVPYDPARAAEIAAIEEEITSLEQEISKDEEKIKGWISDPEIDPVAIADDPEFREVAKRLPRLQSDLQSLLQRKRRVEEP